MKTYESASVEPGAILGAQGAVEIGDYVYIGMNAIITRGVTIGDHVVIGAGSIVTRDCESNAVYAGNPARKIATLEEYYHKRKALQFSEAKDMVLRYYQRFGRKPPYEILSQYFMLFSTREEAERVPAFKRQMEVLCSFDETAAYMDHRQPPYAGYEAFLDACFSENKRQTDD